jgi:hippurate hydrolase
MVLLIANAGIGPVFNDPALTGRLATALRSAMGADRIVEMPAKMTSEDFAEYGRGSLRSNRH